jgi:hypothetical protein
MFQQEEQRFLEDFSSYEPLKFHRRTDISSELRLSIASEALYSKKYSLPRHLGGKITRLSEKYQVSRPFIYSLKAHLCVLGSLLFCIGNENENDCTKLTKKVELTREILTLRLEGKCPIEGISTLLKRKQLQGSSVGNISKILNMIGSQLEDEIELDNTITYAVFASDEVFSSGRPILITVDAVSSAILKIELCEDRGKKSWERHWEGLLSKGIRPLYLTNDEGVGMKAAQETVLEDVRRQSDTFHAVSHRLGDMCRILENKAYKAIETEYERLEVMNKAKSKSVQLKKIELYQAAKNQSERLINLYEDYKFWYHLAIDQFAIFDEIGRLKTTVEALENLQLAMKELQLLDWKGCGLNSHKAKLEQHCATIRSLENDLFYFLEHAKSIVEPLLNQANAMEKKVIYSLCKAFQHGKNYRKVKSPKAKKYHQYKEKEQLIVAQIQFEEAHKTVHREKQLSLNQVQGLFLAFSKKVYNQLDTIVQASSMVETINSIVRSYFNVSKNQVNQAQLNLIAFYHNHRKYKQGKRKGFSPMELFTGEKQTEDWLDILLSKISLN